MVSNTPSIMQPEFVQLSDLVQGRAYQLETNGPWAIRWILVELKNPPTRRVCRIIEVYHLVFLPFAFCVGRARTLAHARRALDVLTTIPDWPDSGDRPTPLFLARLEELLEVLYSQNIITPNGEK